MNTHLNLTLELKNLRGEPVLEADGKTPATMRYICCSALITPVNAPAQAKFNRVALAVRLRDAATHVIIDEVELALLREAIGDAFPQPEIVYQAWLQLDTPTPALVECPPS